MNYDFKNKLVINEKGRIDKILSKELSVSRNKIQELIQKELIFCNDKIVYHNNFIVEEQDEVFIKKMCIDKYLPKKIEPYDMQLEILYEDEYFLIINKPSGILMHPTIHGENNTILNSALNYFKKNKILSDPWIIHRLDKNTSGIVMIAKGVDALNAMQKIFNQRNVTKKYYALVHHRFHGNNQLIIDVPIAHSYQDKMRMNAINGKNPKAAKTLVEIIKNYNNAALVSCNLLTGRTHQIRVHMRYINHPIINDDLYGIESKTTSYKQYLHAYHLAFVHPFTKKEIEINTPMPKEFIDKINEL